MGRKSTPFGYLPSGDASRTAVAHGGNPQDRAASPQSSWVQIPRMNKQLFQLARRHLN
ncbi:MAG: hypothetical protein AAF757_31505 [Cyanobacteria bacterium P01_D01_bin.116]